MKKGFTMIEILVVATIMALLASIATISYSQFGKQSRDARRQADIEQIRAAIELYRSNNNAYPATVTAGGNICDPLGCASGTYMQTVPADPRAPTYSYYYTGAANDYTIGAYREGGGTTCVAGQCGGNCNYCFGPYGRK